LRKPIRNRNFFFPVLVSLFLFLPAGCFYRLDVEPPSSPNINPKDYQPVVLFPIPDASGQPESGADLSSFIRESLEKKGYVLVKQDAVSEILEEMKLTPALLLSDPDSLVKIGERLKAKLLIIGTFAEYKVQKAYWDAQTMRGWNREEYESLSLPTYHWGTSQIRLILRIFESETGAPVWVTEGSIRVSGNSTKLYGENLAERLLKDLPPVPPLKKD
jgi:hypothetical protein